MNSLFLGYTQLLQNGPTDILGNWWRKLEKDFLPPIKGRAMFWTPVHIFNFYFISPKYRVLYLSCGLVAWTAYISMIGYREGRAAVAMQHGHHALAATPGVPSHVKDDVEK